MAALQLGGSVLGAFLDVLFDKVGSHAIEKLGASFGLKDDFRKLDMTLRKIKSLLADAESRVEINPENYLKEWIEDLRDAAYDADDVLDELQYEQLRRKVEEDHDQVNAFSKVFKINYLKECSCSVLVGAPKIRVLQKRLDNILALAGDYQLEELSTSMRPLQFGTASRETSSLLDDEPVMGRDVVKDRVINLLQSAPEAVFQVVPMIGIGGVGKTTLAQLVFNDEVIKKHFQLMMWVCVSDDFDTIRLTSKILESATSEQCDCVNLDVLQNRLKDKLTGKRFLLVLDDVWNEENGKWDYLKKPFISGEKGSKILVTTRSNRVAAIMSATKSATKPVQPVLLEGLPDEHFWALFERFAFAGSDSGRHQNLEEIGRQIAKKLKGSPLAAKTVGRLLSSNISSEHWGDILENEIWRRLPQENSDIMPALRLSYEHLPEYVKPCFAFCSLFPKDFVFDRKQLVEMWIAHDYIQPQENMLLEDTGSEYVDGLLSRSMFQSRPGRFSSDDFFVMHDLIHDLARMISKDEYHCVEDDDDLEKIIKSRSIRHLCIFCDSVALSKVKELQSLTNMRTLLFFHSDKVAKQIQAPFSSDCALEDIFLKAKQLRLLDISCFAITNLPSCINQLKHLRYLNVAKTIIGRLPESIFSLYNLQVLRCDQDFQYFKGTEISKLLNLRHCYGFWRFHYVNGTAISLMLPHVDIGAYNGYQIRSNCMLQELNCKVSDKIDGNIKGLEGMKQLRELKIEGLENVASKEDAIGASLTSKQYLRELELVWTRRGGDGFSSSNNDEKILDGLQPPRRTRVLKIVNYDGVRSPSWMKDDIFVPYIGNLSLRGCVKWEVLPPLGGLRHLKSLEIGLHGVKHVGPDFFGKEGEVNGFPSLEVLSFVDMLMWETWEKVRNGAKLFPHLRTLEIRRCPKLREIPFQIPPALSEFTLIDCPMLLPPGFIFLPPTLTRLTLESCGDFGHALRSTHLENLNLLKDLSINDCPNLVGPLPLNAALKGLATLRVQDCSGLTLGSGFEGLTCLSSLSIVNCPNMLGSLPPTDAALKGLATLRVQDCSGLTLGSGFEGLTCLSSLSIVNCPNMLGSLVEDRLVLLPSSLKYLSITGGCSPGLATEYDIDAALSTCMRNLTSLRELKISKIELSQFRCLEKLTSLQQLTISNCPAVTTIERDVLQHLTSLWSLNISDCKELKSVDFHALVSLDELSIYNCPKLLPTASSLSGTFNCCSCTTLDLRKMPLWQLKEWWLRLDTFPDLYDLWISSCSELTSFDADLEPAALHNLSNLKYLQIEECPSLLSLPVGLSGLSSLKDLGIHNCPKIQSFPVDGLPSSLTHLNIKDLPVADLETALRNLNRLEELRISGCQSLQSLPKNGLPSSIDALYIEDCPVLKQRCEMHVGPDWSKVSHIRCVRIDGKRIPTDA